MNFFKTVAVAAAVVMAASPVLARQGNGGGGGGGGKSGGGHSASRSMQSSSSAVRHAPFQRSQKPSQAGQRPFPQKTQTSQSQFPKHQQQSQQKHKPGPYFPNKQANNHNKPFPHQKPFPHNKPYPHNKPFPQQHMKPHHIPTKWHIKPGSTKFKWAHFHYRPYRDTWGHYYNVSSRCWYDGSRSYCGSLPFRYVSGVWYYGEYKWYKTSYGWKCDAPEPPSCDTCQTAYVAPAPKPVCYTCQAPAPAPEPICDTCQAPPAPEPVQQPCDTCQAPPPPCDTCETQDSL